MNRSELNGIIGAAIEFMTARNIPLPPFASWKKEDWMAAGPSTGKSWTTCLDGTLRISEAGTSRRSGF